MPRLKGCTVVPLGQAIAAPLATRQPPELGALADEIAAWRAAGAV